MFVSDRDIANSDQAMSDREPFASKYFHVRAVLAILVCDRIGILNSKSSEKSVYVNIQACCLPKPDFNVILGENRTHKTKNADCSSDAERQRCLMTS